MKNTIIVLIVIAFSSVPAIAERTNTLMDEEFVSYETCKAIILNNIRNIQADCIEKTTGDARHCVSSPSEINGTIRAECGVSSKPRKQKPKGK